MSFVEIQNGTTISAQDADFHPETEGDLDTFDTDKGPSRVTLWVPSEAVALNLGEAVFGSSGTQEQTAKGGAKTEIDAGFVAQTNHHVHFHTFGDPPKGIPTSIARAVLRLGTPVTVVKAVGNYASTETDNLALLKTTDNLESTEIGSVYPPPYNAWDGYAMVTEGGAVHESYGNNLIVSGNADVRVGAKRSVTVASPGYVHIRAAAGDSMVDVIGNKSGVSPDELDGATTWVGGKQGWMDVDATLTTISAGLSMFSTFYSLYHIEYFRPSEALKPGWKDWMTGTAADKLGDLFALVGSVATPAFGVLGAVLSIKAAATPDDPPDNTVTIYGSSGVTVTSAATTTVHGLLSAAVSGTLTASLTSSVSTSVSSLVATSVGGTATTVNGLLSVGMTSTFGSATVTGKSKAQLSSWGNVFVSGNDYVQVNSVDNNLYLHGNKGFYLGCGAGDAQPQTTLGGTTGMEYADGPGYGITGDPKKGIQIAKFNPANNFKSPTPVQLNSIIMNDSHIYMKHGMSSIELTQEDLYLGQGLAKAKIHIG